jgi:hypothetical protein
MTPPQRVCPQLQGAWLTSVSSLKYRNHAGPAIPRVPEEIAHSNLLLKFSLIPILIQKNKIRITFILYNLKIYN